jgi:hypothetical protein
MVLFKKALFVIIHTQNQAFVIYSHPLKSKFSCQIVVQQRIDEMITFLLHKQCPFRNIVKSVTRLTNSA